MSCGAVSAVEAVERAAELHAGRNRNQIITSIAVVQALYSVFVMHN